MGEIDRQLGVNIELVASTDAELYEVDLKDKDVERMMRGISLYLVTGKRPGDEPPEIGPSFSTDPEDSPGGGDVIALPIPRESLEYMGDLALAAA